MRRFKDYLDENIASNWEAVHFLHFQKQVKELEAGRTRTEGQREDIEVWGLWTLTLGSNCLYRCKCHHFLGWRRAEDLTPPPWILHQSVSWAQLKASSRTYHLLAIKPNLIFSGPIQAKSTRPSPSYLNSCLQPCHIYMRLMRYTSYTHYLSVLISVKEAGLEGALHEGCEVACFT